MKTKYTCERNVKIGRQRRRPFERLFLFNRHVNFIIRYSAKLFLTFLIWPRFVAPYRWRVTRLALPLANLDPAFRGYKILQITDLHVGKTKVEYLARVLEKCRDEKPDLIVITGDLIDYRRRALPKLKKLIAPLAAAKPPDGVVVIFGNHDYHEYSWRHIGPRSARRVIHKRLVGMVREAGFHLLRNEQFRVRRGDSEFILVGMDEMWTERADPDAAFKGLSPGDPVICLQHNPDGVEFLKPYPWQFMLCGHSHGGQAVLPVIGALWVPMEFRQYLRGHFYFDGLNGSGRRVMYVSTGIGHSTPIRLFCPPEVTLFTLESKNAP